MTRSFFLGSSRYIHRERTIYMFNIRAVWVCYFIEFFRPPLRCSMRFSCPYAVGWTHSVVFFCILNFFWVIFFLPSIATINIKMCFLFPFFLLLKQETVCAVCVGKHVTYIELIWSKTQTHLLRKFSGLYFIAHLKITAYKKTLDRQAKRRGELIKKNVFHYIRGKSL